MVAGPPPPAAPAATTPVRARVRHIEEIHDADVLRQVAVLLERENARLHERLQTLTAELAQLRGQDATTAQAQLAFLRELLAQRERALFGDASEKRPRSDSFSTV
jgi:hypothetical protein